MKSHQTQQQISFASYIYMYVCRGASPRTLLAQGLGFFFAVSFFLCVSIPHPAEAQVAHVQDFGNAVAAGSPLTATSSVSVTPGNSLVVFARQTASAVRTYVVSDDIEGTNNWVQLISTTTGSYGVYMWYKQNASPDITQVSVTHGQATASFVMGVSEFSGFGSTVRVVATTSRTDGSVVRNIHHASVNGITATEEVLSVVAGEATATFTEGEPGIGYTEVTNGYASNQGVFQHQVLAAASTTQEAWNIRNTIYDDISTSTTAQDISPQEVTFSPDGTNMYVAGSTGGRIYHYTLSTPWDVSSASFTASTSVTAQETTPLGVFFSATGTRMWVVGSTADRVFQYDLSVAWDLSTRVYNNASTSVNAQDSSPSAISFSQNGMKMFVHGNTNQRIFQYSLAASFDLSTVATYDSVSTSTNVHDSSATGMAFHASGTKVYILGVTNDRVYEYTLSTPWDVSTMAYTETYYIVPQDGTGTSVYLRPNGLKLYIVGNINDRVYQHSVIAEAGIWRNTGSARIAITGMAYLAGSSATDKTISGVLYSDEGLTRDTATRTIGVAVGTSTRVYYTTSSTTGEWTAYVASTSIATGTPIVVWVDGDETTRATLSTKASSTANITGLELYQNRVVISHEGVSGTSTTINDLSFYDVDNDRDIQYRAIASTTSTKASLTVLSNQELYIKSGKTFASEGDVTINANGSTTSATDGNLHLPGTATYTAGGHTIIGGSFTASGTATFTDNQYVLRFNATTTGKSVSVPLSTLGNVYFSGQNGTWAFATSATTSNFHIGNNATVTAPALLTIQNNYVNGGGFIHNNGTVRMASTSAQGISGLTGTSSAFSTLSIERGGSVSVEPLLTSVVTSEGSSPFHFAIDARDRILYAVAGTTVYRCALITDCDESGDFSGTTTVQGATVLSIQIDSVNRVLYMTEINGGGLIIRCALSTNCDAPGDFTTAYDSADSGLVSLTVYASSTGGILFVGSYSTGIIYRCHLSTNCDAQGDFTTAYDTSEFDITALTTYATSTGGILYVGSYPGGIIYRCHLSTDCNAVGDFTTAYDTTSSQINSFAVDTVDSVLYVGGDSGDLFRCPFSTDCNASGDFATVADYFGSSDSLDIDTTARTLYLTDGVSIYRCRLSSNCDTQAEFATSTGYTQALNLGNLIVDQVYDVVYFDNGDLQRCALCMTSDGTSMSATNLTIQNGASFAQAIETRLSGDYTNNGTSTVNDITPSMVFTGASAQSISGALVATSSLGSVLFTGAGTKTFNNNASTINMGIASGVTVIAPTSLTISGTYTNNGTFSHNSGTVDMQSYIVEYLAGRSYTGASTSTASGYAALDLIASGNYLYVGGIGDATACSQTVGSATGCELKVYDISSPSNPVYVAGRDSSGNASGSTANTIYSLAISGNYLYTGERDALGNPACSQTAGSAEGCELKVYDISSSTNPIYVAGRDSTGDASGIGFSYGLLSLTVSGNYLYVGKDADGGVACSQTAGSADGCVLQIYDISSSTNPIYVAGRDAYGSGNMQVYDGIASMVISGNYLYVGKGFDVTACSQTAGSAIGCELQVYNISSPTNPIYVAGRDASGDASGTGTVSVIDVSILGNTLYVAKDGSAIACSQTTGSADGCELMVFNISSSTNPVYVAGRDSSGAASGVGTEAIRVLTTYGKALYVGKDTNSESCPSTRSFATGCEITVFDISSTTNPLLRFNNDVSDLTNGDPLFTRAFTFSGTSLYVGSVANSVSSCSQTPVSVGGCVLKVFRVGNPLSGTMTGSSAFNHLIVTGVGSAMNANASTTDLTIASSSTLTAPAQLTVGGDYTNSGTFIHNGGTVTFASSTGARGVYTGTSFSTAGSGNGLPVGAVYTDGYFYVTDNTDALVYKYTATGTYTGASFGVMSAPYGLTYALDHFWIADPGGDRIHKYTSSGVPANFSFDTSNSGNAFPGSLVFAENHLWVTDSTDALVYKYTPQGSYTGTSFSTTGSGGTSPTGIAYVNGYFYIADDAQAEVYVYTTAGVYTGVSFDTAGSGNGSPAGMTYANGALWITDYADARIYKYSLAQTASGNMTGSSTFSNLVFSGATPKAFGDNASSTHVTIATTSGEVSMPQVFTIAGNYVNSTTTGFRSNDGIVYFASSSAQTLTGNMVGSSAFATTSFLGAGTKTFTNNASTTSFLISNSSSTVVAPSQLTLTGHYTNSGTFTGGTGTTTLGGYATQTLSGTMTGSSAFNNLQITNTSGLGSTTQSVRFLAPASTTDTFSMTASTSAQFLAGATSTFQNLRLSGSAGQFISLRSSNPGTQYGLSVPGIQRTVSYVDVRDSSACPTLILATNGTNVNSGNTTCWSFPSISATVASDAHQVFAYLQATTTINPITITENASLASVTAVNDIRLIIATSTTNMRWDTTDTTATMSGTASGKVSPTVSYLGDGAILVINVTSDFSAGDTLTIEGLSYARFETVSPAAVALGVRTSGAGTSTDNIDSRTVTITGTIAIGSHTSGQIDNAFTSRSVSGGELLAFKLTPTGEAITITGLAFPLKGIQGIATGELTNVSLYRDMNSNQIYDASDVAIGGTGSVAISGQTGTLTFSETFNATTTQDYLLIGDVAELIKTDALVLALRPENFTSAGLTSLTTLTESGGINDYQHIRGGAGAGGGGGSIGGVPPTGDGIRTGGGEGGGDEIDPDSGDTIGNEVGFNPPTSNTGSWTTGGSGYTSDGVYATANSSVSHVYGTFGFSVPNNNQITGIVVKLEASGSTAAGTISVRLSWDGGSSVTSLQTTGTLTTSDAVYELGSPSNLWGRSWTASEFNNGNFTLEVVANPSGNTVRIDAIQVRVYHQATGGGGGGGGAVFKEPSRYFANVISAFGDTVTIRIRSFLDWFNW